MKTYLLALDQSTQVTGYALFNRTTQELVAFGHISPKDNDYVARIAKLCEWLENILDLYKNDVEVVIEDIQLQEYEPNGNKKRAKEFGVITFKKLAHVQGALLTVVKRRNLPYDIISSSSWKSTCGIKGRIRNEQKANAKKFAETTYQVNLIQDEADAICIGYHCLHLKNNDCAWA